MRNKFFLISMFCTLFVFLSCKAGDNYEYNISDLSESELKLLVQTLETNLAYFTFSYDVSKDCLYSETCGFEGTELRDGGGYTILLTIDSLSADNISDGRKINIPYSILHFGTVIHSGNVNYDLGAVNDSAILLSFDDCYLENWKKHLSFFTENNLKVTFFVYGNPDNIASFGKTIQDNKLELGYHTLNHKNLLDFCDEETLYKQAIEPVIALHKKYIYAESFAFPNGSWTDYQIDELLKWYKILRFYGSYFTLYKPKEIGEKRAIWSRAIDNNRWQNDEHFERQIFKELLIARITESVFPMTTHNIVDSFDEASDARYAITTARLSFLVLCLEKLNMKSSLYKDYYYYIR